MTVGVVHCKCEPFDIYIGRPSKWGNPYSHKQGTLAEFSIPTVQEAVNKYAEWILTQPDLIAALPELKDKILGCWCKIKGDEPCHGDILLSLAN